MKSKQILDVQQMQHLQELGLDTSNASMVWCKCDCEKEYSHLLPKDEDVFERCLAVKYIPAYTLQDVLDVLPEYIYDSTEQYLLEINMFFKYIRYSRFNDVLTKRNFDRKPIIDAAYELLVWCIERCYVETDKNE